MFKRYWTSCSKYVNHSRLNSHIIIGDLYDHSMSMRIFTLTVLRYSCEIQRRLQGRFGFALIACFVISYNKKWVQRKVSNSGPLKVMDLMHLLIIIEYTVGANLRMNIKKASIV